MEEHAGRVALVTGAAGIGIGQACARRLAQEGATVALCDQHARRTGEVTSALGRAFGERVRGYVFDVSDRRASADALAQIEAELGPVDLLVNNAGLNLRSPLRESEPADWDRVLKVDLTACYDLIRGVLPGMMDRGFGCIVNISSIAAYGIGSGLEAPYAAAKSGLNALTRSTAREGGPRGVRCNAVAPGLVNSRFLKEHAGDFRDQLEQTPLRRFAEPEDIANVVAFLCSEQSRHVTGEVITASGGLYMRP